MFALEDWRAARYYAFSRQWLFSDQPASIDVRLISATNQSLAQRVADGRFREGLLYCINTSEIRLPPLRERHDDLDLMKSSLAGGGESLNLEANEKRTVRSALQRANGNISYAAEALGVTGAALYRRIGKFSL